MLFMFWFWKSSRLPLINFCFCFLFVYSLGLFASNAENLPNNCPTNRISGDIISGCSHVAEVKKKNSELELAPLPAYHIGLLKERKLTALDSIWQKIDACIQDVTRGVRFKNRAQVKSRNCYEVYWDARPYWTAPKVLEELVTRAKDSEVSMSEKSLGLKGAAKCIQISSDLELDKFLYKIRIHLEQILEEMKLDYRKNRLHSHRFRLNFITNEVYSAWAHDFYDQGVNDARVYWNTKCAGFFGLDRSDTIDSSPRRYLIFLTSGSNNFVNVTGSITRGFTEDMRIFLDENDVSFPMVILSSFGGTDINEAMTAGRLLREKGAFTMVSGNCESACTMIFAGGRGRRVGGNGFSYENPSARMGFHRLSVFGVPIPDNSEEYAKVRAYFDQMGVDGWSVERFMKANKGLEFYYPSLEELCMADVVGLSYGMSESAKEMAKRTQYHCK